MKGDWQVFFPDRVEAAFGHRIEEVALGYKPAIRRKIVAIINTDAIPGCFPLESDIAFVAIKTKVSRNPSPSRPKAKGKLP